MPLAPHRFRRPEFQKTVLSGKVIAFAYIMHLNVMTGCVLGSAARGSYAEAHRIPSSCMWQARTAFRVPEIAEFLQFFGRRRFAFVFWRGALATPAATQRESPGERPSAVLQLFYRHKKWAGQRVLRQEMLRTAHSTHGGECNPHESVSIAKSEHRFVVVSSQRKTENYFLWIALPR
jgi:hypothetical protein